MNDTVRETGRGLSYETDLILADCDCRCGRRCRSHGRAAGQTDGKAARIFGITVPPGYRDWRLISVAHEAGNLNDFRALLGNDIAINAYREGKQPFPDGTIIARLAWSYGPSEENNKVFGPCPVLRRRVAYQRSVHGQGFEKIRRNGRTGVCSIQRQQTFRPGGSQNMFCLPRICHGA